MKLIGLEEHFVTDEILKSWKQVPREWRDLAQDDLANGDIGERLKDLGEGRIKAMDQMGVHVQVLSVTTPGVQNLAPDDAVVMQRELNDRLASAIAKAPTRLQGFAMLATPEPRAAVSELERAVQKLGFNGAMLMGRTRARNMDSKEDWAIYEAAEAMRVPLYLHPQSPVPAVREAYYSGYDTKLNSLFSRAGIGWHYEAGVQLLRMILSGVFDRFPDLQIITGHWGEVVLFYLDRIDMISKPAGLSHPVSHYFKKNVMITPSGIFSERYLRWSLEVLGADRILFSTDYPFVNPKDGGARKFLESAPVSEVDREKIAHGNWEKIVAGIRR